MNYIPSASYVMRADEIVSPVFLLLDCCSVYFHFSTLNLLEPQSYVRNNYFQIIEEKTSQTNKNYIAEMMS